MLSGGWVWKSMEEEFAASAFEELLSGGDRDKTASANTVKYTPTRTQRKSD